MLEGQASEALHRQNHFEDGAMDNVFGNGVPSYSNIVTNCVNPGRLKHHCALRVKSFSTPQFFGHHARDPVGCADVKSFEQHQ